MKRNLLQHQRALFLRVKKGYSYTEIMEEILVPKSTLSGWLSGIELSETQKARLQRKQDEQRHVFNLGEWNRAKRQKEVAIIRVQAKKKLGLLSDRELLIAGTMLYWAEGNKTGKKVGISNADPVFMACIMHWLRHSLGINEDRFLASIHYHEGQDFRKIESFWSEVTGVPLENFRKAFCKPPGTGHRKHYLQWGVCRVYVRKSADLLHQILGWKDGLIEQTIAGIK